MSAGFFGDFAHIYVNTLKTINGLNDAIVRSLLIYNSAQTSNVEFGWTANNGGYSSGVPFSDYMVASATQKPTFFGSMYPLNFDVYYRFKIENVNDIGIFRYYFEGQTTPLGYSPTMSFNDGYALANSEHRNTCDTLYTDLTGLQDMISNGTWSNYSLIGCWYNTSNDWYIHLNSNSGITVNQTTDTWGAPGCHP